jgi:hypothetical protein
MRTPAKTIIIFRHGLRGTALLSMANLCWDSRTVSAGVSEDGDTAIREAQQLQLLSANVGRANIQHNEGQKLYGCTAL